MLIGTINQQIDVETIVYGIPLMLLAGMTIGVVWTLVKALLRESGVAQAKDKRYLDTHDAAGDKLPPVARGVCQSCQQYAATVYYFPNGERICEDCYQPPGKGAKR